jgi:MAF protein
MHMTPQDKPRLILASGSPRRRELIALTGWEVEIRPVEVDESEIPGEQGLSLALRLAEVKARQAVQQFSDGAYILAADTVVESDGEILGKPVSSAEARDMLLKLRSNTHYVHTAIAVSPPGESEIHLDACTTEVPMRDYKNEEIEVYVRTGSPLDKAGAYGIQDDDFDPVQTDQMTGCYANVVGLPICHLVRSMRALGYGPVLDVPSRCQAHTGYDCDVYPMILGIET